MSKEAMKLALEALEYIANETYDPWTNGAEAGRIAQTTLSKIKNKCRAIQTSDQMTCECGNVWDMNDPYPPKCTALREALAEQPAQQEPVAYLCENAVGHQYFRWKKPSSEYKPIALYTSPPAQRTWVGLTDDEIYSVLENLQVMYNRPPTTDSRIIFARAIEAKLKEKNGG